MTGSRGFVDASVGLVSVEDLRRGEGRREQRVSGNRKEMGNERERKEMGKRENDEQAS